jgi:hypothetical protein
MGSGGGGGAKIGGAGGGGGGAVVLIAQGAVTINGIIDASAGDGNDGNANGGGGGGGGSGGSILISGRSVTLGPNHRLFARGGAGGMGTPDLMTGTPNGDGGAGAAGRIWIGGPYTGVGVATDNPTPVPDPSMAASALTMLPMLIPK